MITGFFFFSPQAYGAEVNYYPFLNLSASTLSTNSSESQEFGTKDIVLG